MNILYVTSEALPFAATGGLGDVLGALPPSVRKALGEGNNISVVLPLYPSVKNDFCSELEYMGSARVHLAWRDIYMGLFKATKKGVSFYFIDNEQYFLRAYPYGNYDDGERFAFFCASVLEMFKITGEFPDIIHCNDWQTALCPVYLKLWYSQIEEYKHIKTVYTIHNILYQGQFDEKILWDVFGICERDKKLLEYNGCINLTKAAIQVCDKVTTVSETYAHEILEEHNAFGLHHVLRHNAYKLTGIVNGIDTDLYNPQTDKNITSAYSHTDLHGKGECRQNLMCECGFTNSDIPIVAMVSRLASSKGFELVARVLPEMLDCREINFVILGTGEQRYRDFFEYMSYKYVGNCKAFFEFNKALASKIYSGADMFLMPSESEPCGLAQMIASRYGTVPIVRETGGLFDTVKSYRDDNGEGNGFSFSNYNAHDMMYTVRRAAAIFRDTKKWDRLMRHVMTVDFSWERSAKLYINLYNSLLQEAV